MLVCLHIVRKKDNVKLIILGVGGYGHAVADIAEQLKYDMMFLDDSIDNYLLSSFWSYVSDDTVFIPAFGNNTLRME